MSGRLFDTGILLNPITSSNDIGQKSYSLSISNCRELFCLCPAVFLFTMWYLFFSRVNVLGISEVEALSLPTKESLASLGVLNTSSVPLKTGGKRKSGVDASTVGKRKR